MELSSIIVPIWIFFPRNFLKRICKFVVIVYCKVDKGGVHKPVFHGAGVNISGHFWNVELWRSRWWVTWRSILIKQRRGSIHIQNVTKTQMPLRNKTSCSRSMGKILKRQPSIFTILYSWAIFTSYSDHCAIFCASYRIPNYMKIFLLLQINPALYDFKILRRKLNLMRSLRKKLRMRWFFDVSKVKESRFF